jgi:acyl-CoA reductase-like NAD-dependent aldehyde dehydrogenase
MAELGFYGANLEGYGCAGMSNVEYGLIMQELERGDSGLRSFVSVQGALVMYPLKEYGSEEQKQRVLGYVKSGLEEGARLITGGTVPEQPELGKGYFVKPTIFSDVRADMKIAREEIFGPVLSVFAFDSVEEVVKMANDTRYGLYAGVWTNNLKIAQKVVSEMQAGVVAVNDYLVAYPQTPFGGYKDSGIGYENGIQAISHYTRIKSVTVNT